MPAVPQARPVGFSQHLLTEVHALLGRVFSPIQAPLCSEAAIPASHRRPRLRPPPIRDSLPTRHLAQRLTLARRSPSNPAPASSYSARPRESPAALALARRMVAHHHPYCGFTVVSTSRNSRASSHGRSGFAPSFIPTRILPVSRRRRHCHRMRYLQHSRCTRTPVRQPCSRCRPLKHLIPRHATGAEPQRPPLCLRLPWSPWQGSIVLEAIPRRPPRCQHRCEVRRPGPLAISGSGRATRQPTYPCGAMPMAQSPAPRSRTIHRRISMSNVHWNWRKPGYIADGTPLRHYQAGDTRAGQPEHLRARNGGRCFRTHRAADLARHIVFGDTPKWPRLRHRSTQMGELHATCPSFWTTRT